mmetsp:Transcript_14902/g.22616  ORF Transcript_14902/g.22616 Transcript_14902/m.22616 type:complete len:105 (-) Transcript_14902:86-400(-)
MMSMSHYYLKWQIRLEICWKWKKKMTRWAVKRKKDESKGAKCKWAYIGLHLVLSTLLESDSMDEKESAGVKVEVGECLTELMKIDLNRRERYQNLAAELAGNVS